METGLITWAYPPEKSGLSRAAREIAQALAAAGHRVRVFTFDRSDRTMDGPVEVIGCAPARADGWRRLAAIGHAAAPWRIWQAVSRAHAERPLDVIEGTNWYAPGLFVALLGPAPYVTRNSTPVATSAAPARTIRDRIDLAAARIAERRAAYSSAGTISNTVAHGEKIAKLYGIPAPGPRHAVIGLSLPPEIVAVGMAADYPDTQPVELLFIGRAEARKGYDAILGALPILAADADAGEIPDFRMTMIGLLPEDLGDLPDTVSHRLRLFHRVDECDLHRHLAAAHIVVAPSRYESFGLVYQEAMIFGRPVVACAEDPSARLFVGDSGAGLLAARCDGVALAAPLARLIASAELRDEFHHRSRSAAGRFTRETLATETIAAYREAIAAGTKGRSRAASSPTRPASRSIDS